MCGNIPNFISVEFKIGFTDGGRMLLMITSVKNIKLSNEIAIDLNDGLYIQFNITLK